MLRTVLSMLVVLLVSANSVEAMCVFGLGSCEKSVIAGQYRLSENPSVTLKIDSSKITAQGGPMTFSADYVVKSIEGDKATLEVNAPMAGKGVISVLIKKDGISIPGSGVFGGNWNRQ